MTLLDALYGMQQSGEWCDLKFITSSGEALQAHACVVSAASAKLKEMIRLGNKDNVTMETTVKLPEEIDLDVMRLILYYIYFSKINVDGQEHTKEKSAAHLFEKVSEDVMKAASLLEEDSSEWLHEKNKVYHTRKRRLKSSKCEIPSMPNSEKEQLTNRNIHQVMDIEEQKQLLPTFSCDECDKQFKQRKAWQHHMDKFHCTANKTCEHCQKTFSTQRKLDRHLQRKESRTFCKLCDKSFTNEYVMQLHQRTHTGEERFGCPVCLKRFPYKSSLTMHMLIHSDEKAYICSVCGKSFRQKIHAKEHESRHSGEKRYNCTVCTKSFAQKSGLLRHINDIHHKLKPFVCETCGRSFSRKVKLTEHRRIHTGEKPYVCGECGISYKSNRSLKNHKKSKHGIVVPEYEVAIWGRGSMEPHNVKNSTV